MKHKVRHIHFVGIGGSGMSGIAEVLHNLGFTVSGSDIVSGSVTERLREIGIRVLMGHDARHIQGADVLVVSTAVQPGNVEVVAAQQLKIPVVPRAMMLAELMRFRQGIAVAGTHGKTTTTSMIASILAEANMDPTFVIGGRLESAGSYARLGAGEYIVVEADESDASFLHLSPVISVVTNIDRDHMETYGHDFEKLKQVFVEFIQYLPFWGVAVLCTDDPHVQAILPQVTKSIITYGLNDSAAVRAVDVRADHGRMHFTVLRRNGNVVPDLHVTLNMPGIHYVQNALAAIAVATEINVPDQAIVDALREFKGVGRRFQRYGEVALPAGGHCTLVDDYGHHPVEIRAVLQAARAAYPERRLILAFQPHRYTRTRDLFEDFVQILSEADVLLLTDVYSAGEAPIQAADTRSLVRAMRVLGRVEPIYVAGTAQLPSMILERAQDQDVVIVMGAGSIGQVAAHTAQLACGKVHDAR